jgi:hypothetical protein
MILYKENQLSENYIIFRLKADVSIEITIFFWIDSEIQDLHMPVSNVQSFAFQR